MGLDQYLYAKKYISKFDYSENERKMTPEYMDAIANVPQGLTKYGDYMGAEISVVVAYWRKANQIHKWFVDNVQRGNDDCKEYFVSRDQLIELRDLCCNVLNVPAGVSTTEHAQSLLPPSDGFFFGSMEIDSWYEQDLQNTIVMINHILKMIPQDDTEWSFYYTSSW